VAKITAAEKGQKSACFGPSPGLKFLASNILRKFEHGLAYSCQNSEYLTLLSSFPDVKKTD